MTATTDLDLINEILPRLSSGRADSYEDWLAVGMALYHAGAPCDAWDSWSRQSAKYKEGACAEKWRTFSSSGSTLGMGSLVEWARADGFDPYAGHAYDWDDVVPISANAGEIARIFSNTDLIRYLQAVFKDGEHVNYVMDAYERDGKWLPASKGTVRPVADLLADLQKYDDITFAVGDYKKDAGAWIRFNPVKPGADGSKNDDIADCRHVLVESDGMGIDEQLATIRRLRLPCAAIVNSGGKSVHAIVKIEAGEDWKLYKQRVAFLFDRLQKEKFIVDKACKNQARLSRMPGVFRGGRKQFLVSVNEGCASWAEWEAEIKANDYTLKGYSFDDLFNTPPEDKSDNLLGDRFLTREGSWLVVAQSGVGKSVLAMQMAILFALGRDLWGLKPIKPLKVAIIQAENNKLDLVKPLQSICDNLELTAADRKTLNENLWIEPDSVHCGADFAKLIEKVAKDKTPDIVIIDPLLSYIGGDISKQDVCSFFLRKTVHPILVKHQIGLIIMHHTGKPRSKDEALSGDALSYAGTGSSELTNYVRATSTILQNTEDSSVYNFTYSKRRKQAECEPIVYLKQGENGNIFWERVEKPGEIQKAKRWAAHECDVLKLEEVLEPLQFKEAVERIQSLYREHFKTEPSFKKVKGWISTFVRNGRLVHDEKNKTYQGFYYSYANDK